MAPTNTSKKDTKKAKSSTTKKEKVFHPDSRKADQLNRKVVRKERMGGLTKKRKTRSYETAEFHAIFYDNLPADVLALTLDQVHIIIRDAWLTRHDAEIEAERTDRRKGRPKSLKTGNLEQEVIRDAETYRTGLEVLELTDPTTLMLFRKWDRRDTAYIDMMRRIRVKSDDPTFSYVCRLGRHGDYPPQEPLPKNTDMIIDS